MVKCIALHLVHSSAMVNTHSPCKSGKAYFAHSVQLQTMVWPAETHQERLKRRAWPIFHQCKYSKPYDTLQTYASQKSTHVAACTKPNCNGRFVSCICCDFLCSPYFPISAFVLIAVSCAYISGSDQDSELTVDTAQGKGSPSLGGQHVEP